MANIPETRTGWCIREGKHKESEIVSLTTPSRARNPGTTVVLFEAIAGPISVTAHVDGLHVAAPLVEVVEIPLQERPRAALSFRLEVLHFLAVAPRVV